MNKKSLPFRIRRMEARDLPAVMALDRMVFDDPWPESVYVQELYFNTHARYFVLQLTDWTKDRPHAKDRRRGGFWPRKSRENHRIIGFVGMRVEMKKGHISTLAVRPSWHGCGLGELLLLTALEQAIADNAQSMTLEVRVTNTVAQNLYEKYRFVITSRLRGYYQNGEDAYLMRAAPLNGSYLSMLHEKRAHLTHRLAMDGNYDVEAQCENL